MSKQYIFKGSINKDTIQPVLTFLENNENVIIYFDSSGGNPVYAEILIDAINEAEATVVLTHAICSCAFEVVTSLKKALIVNNSFSLSMIHYANIEIDVMHVGNEIETIPNIQFQTTKKDNKLYYKRYKGFLNKKQKSLLKNGQDVAFGREETLKLFDKMGVKYKIKDAK